MNLNLLVVIIMVHYHQITLAEHKTNINTELYEHTMVSDGELFPYMAAILKKSMYLSAGALIDERWIVTGADPLYMLRDLTRILTVRLGSINYKKGGVLSPVKLFYIHPLFDDNKPQYDVALIKLPEPVRLTPRLNPIQLLRKMREIAVTHFMVTGWVPSQQKKNFLNYPQSMEMIKRRRILTISHVHPTSPEDCADQLEQLAVNTTDGVMCLDPAAGTDACQRDVGAPVVLNGVLWGITSSWKPENCSDGATFVTLVSHVDVSSWIHATVHGHRWTRKHALDYDDNFI